MIYDILSDLCNIMLYIENIYFWNLIMGIAINLDNEFVNIARAYSGAESRSIPKQIERWAKIGRIAEENPDLTYSAIKEILLGLEDMKLGNVQAYDPDAL